MALATQCPDCQTTSRVANDRLKLRAGLVRCVVCREVFNGIEHLVRPGHSAFSETVNNPSSRQHNVLPPIASTWAHDARASASSASKIASSGKLLKTRGTVSTAKVAIIPADALLAGPKNYSGQIETTDRPVFYTTSTLSLPLTSPNVCHRHAITDSSDSNQADPLQRMSLLQVAPGTLDYLKTAVIQASNVILGEVPGEARKISTKINSDIATSKSNSSANIGDVIAEPHFMQEARHKRCVGGIIQTSMWLGSIFLFIILMVQTAYILRDRLAAHVPQLKPMLQRVCSKLSY